MVKDRTNHYYTQLLDGLQALYAGMDGAQKKNDSPPSFPYMYFFQISGAGALETLSGTEEGIDLAYEVRFYSKKSPDDARKIANSARGIMVGELDFRCIHFQPLENAVDSTINQFIARFSKLET